MIDLEAIRARDAKCEYTRYSRVVDDGIQAGEDRRALLAAYDRLTAAAGEALRLLEYADVSDDCQYGTISTVTVRDLLADLRRLLLARIDAHLSRKATASPAPDRDPKATSV